MSVEEGREDDLVRAVLGMGKEILIEDLRRLIQMTSMLTSRWLFEVAEK